MMRLQAAFSAGLAAVLVVPGTLVDERALRRLELALDETVRALEVVTGLEQRAEGQLAPDLLRAVTEGPILDARGRDEQLQALRNEVSLLQMELDALEPGEAVAEQALEQPPASAAPAVEGLTGITTGFDEGLRLLLGDLHRAPAESALPPVVAAAPIPATSPEQAGYSADPVLEARACYFAGQHERGLSLVEPLSEDPNALYWKARLLEKAERLDEAIAALQKVLTLTGTGREAERAKTDLEFLEWKRGFVRRMDGPEGEKP